MHTKEYPSGNGLFQVALYDRLGDYTPLEAVDDVVPDQVEKVLAEMKYRHYDVQSYLDEFLMNMQCDNQKVKGELLILKDDWGEGRLLRYTYRYIFKRPFPGFTTTAVMSVDTSTDAPIEYSEVLELHLDNGFEVANWGESVLDTKGRDGWIEYRCLAPKNKPIATWNQVWAIWKQLKQLFTLEELDLLKHAFEEGRRR